MADDHHGTATPIEQKVAADRSEKFVVFHIGVRINAFWKLHRWLPIVLIAPRMVRELVSDPESGLLGSRTVVGPGIRNIGFIQYWDSFEALRDYARDSDRLHFSAWQEYYEDGTNEDAGVGIWHETYVIDPDEYETVYNNMPPHGLAASDDTEIVPASDQRHTAAGRMGRTDGTDSPPQRTVEEHEMATLEEA
ncbi:DUF4188 domain-containing protein [Natrinema sp. 1APR25-10V2]|uniref:DUF4188 domain-containing protein n=1 Tax=Natrinema sp. 1APR25-10V2 TaxID=2951081 RepID=UPI0028763AE4|nr:DUF4188 domain-containing protein [Natrinema sp. 1APR25-10V2]MDS0474572.1 DUF4188 domain-containing protein [Natrinema sp. 1APR25-10V2]